MKFKYRLVQLNQVSWRGFVENPNPVAVALMSRMRIEPNERPLVKLACLRMLARLNLEPEKSELVSEFFDAYLRLDTNEEQQFQAEFGTIAKEEQEAMIKLTTSWREEFQGRLEQAQELVEQERERAEQERERAEQERKRAERAEAELEALREQVRLLGQKRAD